MLSRHNYNPDVLTCIANLSNDEVFTPPQLVNQILDQLPEDIWRNKYATFLDPACKSGVFLREIAKRLTEGLQEDIPDQKERINHIFKNQIYGIAITELTSLLARRSVYCSKAANGKYSVCDAFDEPEGNILFNQTEHTWENGRCVFCGASQEAYDRGTELESYAYAFIHTANPREVFNMKFDVIIGNPPYQMGSDGGTRDIPIYNKFVEQAKKLNPKYLSMIIPSRWMTSGLGLSEFRSSMLGDRRIRKLVDYPVASEVFTGVEVKGGICYFLWERESDGECEVTSIRGEQITGPVTRNLSEFDVFVRDSIALKILHKVQLKREPSIIEILSVDKEFGWTSNFNGFHYDQEDGDVPIHYIRKIRRGTGWIHRTQITKSADLIDTWKVLIPKAGSDGGQRIPDRVLGKPFVAQSPSVCTQSFLFFFTDSEKKAASIESYLRTKFFRFLVSLRKITQDATRATYTWVPQQSWNQRWTDDALYKRYDLTEDDVKYIELMISPMETTDD